MILTAIVSFLFFKVPFIFPLLIVIGGILTNISSRRIPEPNPAKPKEIKWRNIFRFLAIFLIAGVLSETARKQEWENRKIFNLFENFYRFGSLVFGGGDVLLPMMVDQYVARPEAKKVVERNPNLIRVDRNEMLTGFG